VKKTLLMLISLVMIASMAFAANPVVVNLVDGNNYYPSKTTTIQWTVTDADVPEDANIVLGYCLVTSCGTTTEIVDDNSMTFCDKIISGTSQVCSYNWTLPTGLDGNYLIDVNVFDITNTDDTNDLSANNYIDTNGGTSSISYSNSTFTLSGVWTGIGTDENIGSEQIHFTTSRLKMCGSNYSVYSQPVTLSIGEYTICWYSTDGLGNTETGQSSIRTANSSATAMVNLIPVILAALALVLGAAFILLVVRGGEVDGSTVVLFGIAGIVITILVYVASIII